MSSCFLIYGLIDPRSGQLRYVGKSEHGLHRPNSHRYPSVLAQDRNVHKVNWIRCLETAGLRYEVVVLEECLTVTSLNKAEQRQIARCRAAGANLLNLTKGGEGCRATPETRRKMSESKLGKPRSLELRARLSVLTSNRFKDPNERKKTSLSKGGRGVVDESGVVYLSASDAADKLGLLSSGVCSSARFGWKVGNHVFRYEGELRVTPPRLGLTSHPVIDEAGVVYKSSAEAARALNLWPSNVSRSARLSVKVEGHSFRYLK